eukprot:CAMPEP_0170170910 /NCGR_PEP_ID=MMETSP0040_2-20121228/3960_1 /TAXON_ID=641309 /ORGANISM="Lotharella oceanica, Strain CCMP622" /LENGTH=75 /DNA_ID=CAMNT_0010410625 /DNA_START=37 /DNA_END=264 /DNA_ORIENTATION=+
MADSAVHMDSADEGSPAIFILIFLLMAFGGIGYYVWTQHEKTQQMIASGQIKQRKKYGKKKARKIQLKNRNKYTE